MSQSTVPVAMISNKPVSPQLATEQHCTHTLTEGKNNSLKTPHKTTPYLLHHNKFTFSTYYSCIKIITSHHLTHKEHTNTDITLILAATRCPKTYYNTNPHARHAILLLLLLCGDTGAIVNLGPYQPRHPCVLCTKAVKWGQRTIQCNICCDQSEHAGWYVSCIRSFTQIYWTPLT